MGSEMCIRDRSLFLLYSDVPFINGEAQGNAGFSGPELGPILAIVFEFKHFELALQHRLVREVFGRFIEGESEVQDERFARFQVDGVVRKDLEDPLFRHRQKTLIVVSIHVRAAGLCVFGLRHQRWRTVVPFAAAVFQGDGALGCGSVALLGWQALAPPVPSGSRRSV